MSRLQPSLGILLSCAALALAGSAFADGGGGSRSDSGTDLAAAQRLIDAKNWNGAITELERARRKDNRNAEVHNLLGYSLRQARRLPEAFSEYEAALRLSLDRTQLPKPFQVDAITDRGLQVEAKVLRWQFTAPVVAQ